MSDHTIMIILVIKIFFVQFFCVPDICPAAAAKSLQSCPTLCDPVDCNLLGFSVLGILQARILEWIAISFSGGSSGPRD